jgi:hypothetical protein
LTLDALSDERAALARAVGLTHGARWIHVVLDHGVHRSQPMLTLRAHGSLADALRCAWALRAALAAESLWVARVKIEGELSCAELSEDADGARSGREGRYFEHHTKVLIRGEAERATAFEIAQAHGAHGSRNALARDERGEERFFTLRRSDVLRDLAVAAMDALDQSFTDAGLTVLDRRSEYVVYDSRLELDRGWTAEP